MKEKILGLSSNRLATQEAQRLWLKDQAAKQKARSIQLWDKKELFLRCKNHEESTPSTLSETGYFSSSSDEGSC